MKKIIDYLANLQNNNTKEWFNDHYDEYLEVKDHLDYITTRLVEGISKFDPSVKGLKTRDCTYRFHRDTRFAKDKTPFKSHIGIFISPGGKISGHSGYYVHIEPPHEITKSEKFPVFFGRHMMVVGLYLPVYQIMSGVREEFLSNGEELLRNIGKAEGFELDMTDKTQTVPRGLPNDTKYSEYLKLKSFYVKREIDEAFLLDPNFIENAVAAFLSAHELNRQLNRVVERTYSRLWKSNSRWIERSEMEL